jgi:tetratricopeptide (TPR) repeat protein
MVVMVLVFGVALAPLAAGQSSFANEPKTNPPVVAAPEPAAAPKPALTPELRGDISMARKDFRTAIDLYRSVVPTNHILLNKIGIAYHQMTELDQARKHYERAIKMNPKYAEAVNNLGTVYYAARSHRRAVKQYERALKLSPNSASIYSNLGTAWFARRNYKKASAAYAKALELDPEVFEHRSSGGVLLQERSVEERAKFHYYLAKTYAKAGMAERALMYMRRCLEEGFKDRKKFVEEPEFANLQQLPEFQALMLSQPRVL